VPYLTVAVTTQAGQAGVFEEKRGHLALGGEWVGSERVVQALTFSLFDGISATVMVALTETYGIAAAVALDAPSMAIAVLGSAPLFLGSVGQYLLLTPTRGARKRVVLRGVALQATLLALAGLSGFLPAGYAAWVYVGCFVLAGFSANVTAASWTSWMGDLVPPQIRGRHFAWRSRVFSLVNLSCSLAVGLLAQRYDPRNAQWELFTAIFLCAAAFRWLSLQMLKQQYEPERRASLPPLARAKPSPEFKRFCWTNGLVQAATAMSAPFFTLWYVRDLRFNYLMLAAVGCSTVLGNIVALPLWGRLADRHGGARILRFAGVLVCLVPLPSCFSGDSRVVCLASLFGGIAWAGYNLASFNQLLHLSEEGSRTSLIAYATVVTGVLVFPMTLVGGYLATHLPVVFTWRVQTLFFISMLLRVGAIALMMPRLGSLQWPQAAEELFNAIPSYRAGLGLLRNVFRAFRG
jgi:MFS family permease